MSTEKNKEPITHFKFYVEPDLLEELSEYCAKYSLNRQKIIKYILSKFMDKHGYKY